MTSIPNKTVQRYIVIKLSKIMEKENSNGTNTRVTIKEVLTSSAKTLQANGMLYSSIKRNIAK